MMDLPEPNDAELRRQTFLRTLKLISAGIRHCRGCGEETECFVKRKAPGGGDQAVLPRLLESGALARPRYRAQSRCPQEHHARR